MKPGHKTTEFWISLLVIVGACVATLAGNLPDKYAAIASTISVAAYSLARGLAKQGTGSSGNRV